MNPLLSKEIEKFLSKILVAKGVALHAEHAMRMLCSLELEVRLGNESRTVTIVNTCQVRN